MKPGLYRMTKTRSIYNLADDCIVNTAHPDDLIVVLGFSVIYRDKWDPAYDEMVVYVAGKSFGYMCMARAEKAVALEFVG